MTFKTMIDGVLHTIVTLLLLLLFSTVFSANKRSQANPVRSQFGTFSEMIYIRHKKTRLCYLWATIKQNNTKHHGLTIVPCGSIPQNRSRGRRK